MKTKRTRFLAMLMAVLMVCLLTGCEVSTSSSSTTTVTTSKTDADGNTTTNTVTNEVGVSAGTNGVSTTNETTTETTTTSADEASGAEDDADSWDELKAHLYDMYTTGAEGTNEDGDMFYYAFNEEDGKDTALIVIVSADGEHYNGWEGTTDVVDDHVVLYSDDEDTEIPFTFSDADDTGTFTLSFLGDGDEATMQFVDWDSFVEDVVAARRSFD